ncbi:MAG TPA: DinB family protein [Terriglobales bacterium]
MNHRWTAVASLVTLAASLGLAQASGPAASSPQTTTTSSSPQAAPTMAKALEGELNRIEREFVSAAEAMPEDKYAFAPSNGEFKGVRTFGQQVKHVATANYMFGAGISGEKPPVDLAGGEGAASIQSKADIVKYVKDSFAYVHKAFQQITVDNAVTPIPSPFGKGQVTRLGLAVLTVGHGFDHYGQMVEYLRMNGIVPPASRK